MQKIPGLRKVRDIHGQVSNDVVSLVDSMGRGGGFMGRNLAEVAELLERMAARKQCFKFLSFPAAMVATGSRGLISDLIKEKFFDAVITTCGTLDHDIARTRADYYVGSFEMDDTKLLKAGYHRLGNVLVPLDSYGPLVEKFMQPLLERVYREGNHSITTEALCNEIGRALGSRSSILYQAYKNHVPVFVPGITDGAVGSQLWLFSERHRDFRVELLGDEKRLSDITSGAEETGALVIGGGISKHHLIWWNLFRGGLDYACYITTAQEFDGSLSGAQIREAVSWGKVKEKASTASLYADVTTVLPFIVSYLMTKKSGRRS